MCQKYGMTPLLVTFNHTFNTNLGIRNLNNLVEKLKYNTQLFRKKMIESGFDLKEGIHSIVPIMLGDAILAQDFASKMLEEGIYVIGFSFPVVPKGEARIRVQISAGHEKHQLAKAITAFVKVGKELKVI